MKVAIGTVEVSDLEREALGAHMNRGGKADREDITYHFHSLWMDFIGEIAEAYAEKKAAEELAELEARIEEMEERRAALAERA